MPYIVFNLIFSIILLTSNTVRGWWIRLIIWLWTAFTVMIAIGMFTAPVVQFFHKFHF